MKPQDTRMSHYLGEKNKATKKTELKEMLEKKVDDKIQIINELWRYIEEKKGLLLEDFESAMNLYKDKLFECFDSKFKDRFERYNRYLARYELNRSKRDEVINKYNAKYGKYDDKILDDEEYGKLMEEEYFLIEKLNDLYDDDILFVEKVVKFIKHIISKRREVSYYESLYDKDNINALLDSIPFINFSQLSDKDKSKIKIRFNGYSVSIILSERAYKKVVSEKSVGVHYDGTVINLISDSSNKNETIRHEENHNLTESFAAGDPVYAKEFLNKIKEGINTINRLHAAGAPEIIIGSLKNNIMRMIADYSLSNSDELIVDIDSPSKKNIRGYVNHFLTTINALEAFVNRMEGSKLRRELFLAIDELEKKFITYVKRIADIYFVADNTGYSRETRGAMLLFGYHNLAKVERYLKSKVGKERYNVIKLLRIVSKDGTIYFGEAKKAEKKAGFLGYLFGNYGVNRFWNIISELVGNRRCFFEVENLRCLVENLHTLKNTNRDYFNQAISLIDSNKILHSRDSKLFIEKIKNIEELIEIDNLLKELSDIFNMPKLFNQVERDFLPGFIYSLYKVCLANNDFSKLGEIWSNSYFNMNDSRQFIEDLLPCDVWDVDDDLGNEFNQDVKKMNFWQFMRKIGSEEMAKREYNRIKRMRND